MKILSEKGTLVLSELTELNAANSPGLRDQARAAIQGEVMCLDVDLSQTRFIDSSGLGMLISLHKTMAARGGTLRVINPTPSVQQIMELTRLHRVFEIVKP